VLIATIASCLNETLQLCGGDVAQLQKFSVTRQNAIDLEIK
jgi:hypothetical protein